MPIHDNTARGHFRFRTKSREKRFQLDPIKDRKHSARRKALSKNRIYLKTPVDWYKYHREDPRYVTSSYRRDGTFDRALSEPRVYKGRKVVYDKLFPGHNARSVRKGMIIGEREPLWNVPHGRSPELPGNLFVDNLREQEIDWRKFNRVTWNDILESHMKDVSRTRDYAQTLPQKEAWLASIDSRVRYSKMKPDRELPHVSPRLFNNKREPPKPPQVARYVSKDKMGNVLYVVGPSDVTNKQYRPYLLPEILKPSASPTKLNF